MKMANTFYLEILASDRKFFCGDCEMLVFPAIDGEYGIMPNHESMVTCLQAGELRFKIDGEWKYAAVSDGFVDVMQKNVVLLADTVELPEEIDRKRAEAAMLRAQERRRQKQSIKEYYQTEAAMNRALSRLKVSNRHKQS
jgi:F-type H+-transporting ATPase subunit epsilon